MCVRVRGCGSTFHNIKGPVGSCRNEKDKTLVTGLSSAAQWSVCEHLCVCGSVPHTSRCDGDDTASSHPPNKED